ncbi:hypothetical protein FQN54_008517 [Arachnomyces sp. PD_36]|nr:hypothetical protein FQN54_008517 [Arachnomyces sp. PD_36]
MAQQQQQQPSRTQIPPDIDIEDRIKGAIVGSALGDTLGLYTEFLSKELSRKEYPDAKFQLVEPATEFSLDIHRGKKAWSDDTDHALLIILSYLHHDGKELSPNDFAARLLVWVEQGLLCIQKLPHGCGNTVTMVIQSPGFREDPAAVVYGHWSDSDRNNASTGSLIRLCLQKLPHGCGKTVAKVIHSPEFLKDPAEVAYRHWNDSGRNNAPNGSLMRTHPLGVLCIHASREETFQTAAKFSVVTHADPRCVVSCCISTALIRGILRGEVMREGDIDSLIQETFNWVTTGWLEKDRRFDDGGEEAPANKGEESCAGDDDNDNNTPTTNQKPEPALDRTELDKYVTANNFSDLHLDDPMTMGYVYKSLGAGILALRLGMRSAPQGQHHHHHPPPPPPPPSNLFETIITDLIMEGGDADTNACVAGAIIGSWVGYEALPPHWRDGMAHREWLLGKCEGMMQILLGVGGGGGGGSVSGIGYKGSEDPDTREDGGKGFRTREEWEARERAFRRKYMMEFMPKYMRRRVYREDREARAKRGWFARMFW